MVGSVPALVALRRATCRSATRSTLRHHKIVDQMVTQLNFIQFTDLWDELVMPNKD